MIRAIIFDMDGTLLDSETLWIRTPALLMAEMGCPVPATLSGVWGKARLRVQLRALCDIGAQPHGMSWDDCVAWCRERVLRFYFEDIPLKPGARAWLDRLNALGVPMAILTATREDAALAILRKKNLLHSFRFVASTFDTAATKESPEIFGLTAARLGFLPGECLVVDDTPFAIESAKAAGCPAWGVYEAVQGADSAQRIQAAGGQYFLSLQDAMKTFDETCAPTFEGRDA